MYIEEMELSHGLTSEMHICTRYGIRLNVKPDGDLLLRVDFREFDEGNMKQCVRHLFSIPEVKFCEKHNK